MSASTKSPLKYLRNNQIRAAIAEAVGLDPDRYRDTPNYNVGFKKDHLRTIARALGPGEETDVEALTVAELLGLVCRLAGDEYDGTAGNQWALKRRNLKAIALRVTDHPPE